MSIASPVEHLMLDLINAERAQAGIQPLTLELDLNAAAEGHSAWMLQTGTFAHDGAEGSTVRDRIEAAGFALQGRAAWAENIGWQSLRGEEGIEDDILAIHENLMQSPPHRANILSADFDHIGIGIEPGGFRGTDALMITQNFGRTEAQTRSDPGPSAPDEPQGATPPEAAPPVADEEPVPPIVSEAPEAEGEAPGDDALPPLSDPVDLAFGPEAPEAEGEAPGDGALPPPSDPVDFAFDLETPAPGEPAPGEIVEGLPVVEDAIGGRGMVWAALAGVRFGSPEEAREAGAVALSVLESLMRGGLAEAARAGAARPEGGGLEGVAFAFGHGLGLGIGHEAGHDASYAPGARGAERAEGHDCAGWHEVALLLQPPVTDDFLM